MYIFCMLFLVVVFFFCINLWRRKRIIKKICCMCMDEKCTLLDGLIQPFGFSYVPSQDIFTSRIDAWQRNFGYRDFFDRTAVYYNMVFDYLPIYFDYDGRTWLIELWKGQYGISSGCEIGVYHADRILAKKERKRAHFQCANNDEMPCLSFALYEGNHLLADLCAKHWWLTAFLIGHFSWPSALCLHASITFSSMEMAHAFVKGLQHTRCHSDKICACGNIVSFTFYRSDRESCFFRRLAICLSQWLNKCCCKLYLFITRPFCLSIDKVLYLYYYLPFVFRKMFGIRRYKKHKKKHNPKCNDCKARTKMVK